MEIVKQTSRAVVLFTLLSLITGLIYPGVVTLIAQEFFSWRANGSMLVENGRTVGSLLIGQSFTDPGYFWGRPSATTPFPYNAAYSSGSNLEPANPALLAQIKERVATLHRADKKNVMFIPVDLVTASASGLDPDISPEAAFYQVPRVAKARHLKESDLTALIFRLISPRTFNILGEPRVNVLQLNLALSSLSSQSFHTMSISDERKAP